MSSYDIQCPHCHAAMHAEHPGGYEPIHVDCASCGEQFILEPVANGVKTYRKGEAPCCSDPECRAIELGAGND